MFERISLRPRRGSQGHKIGLIYRNVKRLNMLAVTKYRQEETIYTRWKTTIKNPPNQAS